MASVSATLTLFLTSVVLAEGQETQEIHINCIFSRDCTLPCRFKKSGKENVIQWVKGEKHVHSFYDNKDHLEHQDQDYKGRTALFKEQIVYGNASLLLRWVKLQDEGTYKCHTGYNSNSDESFAEVTVKAPITSVDITETDDEVTCSSSGVYPAPAVSWLTDPSSSQEILKVTKDNSVDQQGLYSVKSTLKKIQGNSTAYICSVTSNGQKWSASLRNEVEKNINETQTLSIQCPVHQSDSQDFSITWTFNSASTIVIYDSQTQELKKSDQWELVVKAVTGEGTLQLQNLRSTEHSGTYTCDRTTVNSRDIVHTYVQIIPSQESNVGLYVGISVAVAVVIIAGIVIYMKKCRGNCANGVIYASETDAPTETDYCMDKTDQELKECE